MFRQAVKLQLRRASQLGKRNATRRHASSSAASGGSDAKWLVFSVLITVPTLGYLLSPPSKKADVHKAIHKSAAIVGIHEATPEQIEETLPDEVAGPDSREDPEENEKSEVPKEQAARESKHISGSTADEEKPGRESGATKPGATEGSGKIENKQAGLSNTQTMHNSNPGLRDGEHQNKTIGTIEANEDRKQTMEQEDERSDDEEETAGEHNEDEDAREDKSSEASDSKE